MKILALFDLAHAVDPGQEFSPESLKEQDKPTEACVLECLKRLGHDVETLAVFDNVPGHRRKADHLRARPGLQSLRILPSRPLA